MPSPDSLVIPLALSRTGPWWEVRAFASTDGASTAELLIYADIGESWDESTVSARELVDVLGQIEAESLTVRINSYGGSVPDGLAIYNALRRHPAAVTVEIDGIAASIASLIAMAGDTVQIAANALLMIHAPWALAIGNAVDLRKMADTLDRYAHAMSAAYARGAVTREDALALLTDGDDHWMTADEALSAGYVDAITPALAIAASVPERYQPRGRAAALTQEPTMAEQTPAAAPSEPTAPNVTEIQANADKAARAALQARNAGLKVRNDAFLKAYPGREAEIRSCYDAAIGDFDQTLDGFTESVLAKLAERPDTPIGADYTVRADLLEDQRDKLKSACAEALLARAAVTKGTDALRANPFRGETLLDIARGSLRRAGLKVDGMLPMEIVAAAFTQSTSDFPVLMENTMNKALLAGYAIASDTWRRFCAVGSVSDFRAHNRYMLGSLGDLQDLNEAGEFKNQSIPDGRKQSVSIGTKGAIINLTRQAIINDDLGAFVGLADARGRAAARTIENTVYSAIALNSGYGPTLSDGKTIIHADHGNIAATGGAPSVTTVESGILAMAAQKDITGNDYLDLSPTLMLVPKGLELTARKINTDTFDPNATGTTKNFNASNPYQGYFSDIVASQRLAAVKWYMLASPDVAPVLEVSFLNGVQEPAMEMEMGFSVDGARWKTRLDFGVSGVGYEGIVYNAGA